MHGMTKNIREPNIVRNIPKNVPLDLSGADPKELKMLERVAASKVKVKAKVREPDTIDGPTAARLDKSDGFITVGDDKQGGKTYTMRDSPLDRAHKKGIISGAEHSALQKYRHHWYHAGQAPTISSLDLDRIFSGGDGGPAGMPKSEGQVFHRQRWREAQQCLGLRSAAVVDRFVCQEENLELCGQLIGWANKPQAIAGAAELVKDAGYRLARLWGIG